MATKKLEAEFMNLKKEFVGLQNLIQNLLDKHGDLEKSTGNPRPTKQNFSISTYVWLFPLMNHCGKKAICVEISIICGFSQIYLGKTIDICKWECPCECGKNHTIDQMIR